MVKRSLRQWCLRVCFAIVAGFFFAAPSSSSAAPPPRHEPAKRVRLQDTGQTIALSVGQQLIVTLPLWPPYDNSWYVTSNSGAGLKLIAGPNELRPRNWALGQPSSQVFYFRRESPGIAHLVLEQKMPQHGGPGAKPMVLDVVDR